MNVENKNQLSSSKCDFRFSFADMKFEGKQAASGTNWSSESLNRKVSVQSSKCDWRVISNDEAFQVNTFRSDKNFKIDSRIRGMAASMGSDKCDFRINSRMDEVVLPMKLSAEGPAVTMHLSSDKCDWKIQAGGGIRETKGRPKFEASLSSAKCDFNLRIRFGLEGAKNIYVGAISSSKCDFRINDSSIYENKG
jgi:hypothetical protein